MLCRQQYVAVLITLLVSLSSITINTADITPDEYYGNVVDADLSKSYDNIRNIPIKMYEFLHDSKSGRVQMGVLSSDAQRYIPEAIDVIPSMTFPSKDKSKPPVVLKNFKSVDKNTIFVHGVAALKKLILESEKIEADILELESLGSKTKEAFDALEKRIFADVTEARIEEKKLLESEIELTKKQMELESLREEEEKKIIERRLADERSLKTYEAELAIQRMKQEEQNVKNEMQELLKMERELAERKEKIRMEVSEKLRAKQKEVNDALELQKLEHEKEKIRMEIQLKGEQERANEDATLRRIKLEAELSSQQTMAAISAFGEEASKIALVLISNPQQIAIVGGVILLFMFCYYVLREVISSIRDAVQAAIGRPSLVRETSMHWHFLPSFITNLFPVESHTKSIEEIEKKFADVVLAIDDRARVVQLAVTTRNTKQTSAPYRHILLHGPPGTGKTLIARKLAESSNMDYAIMSGGDVGPLGDDAVNQLHRLFKWADSSRRGLLVFIDEAEAFLSTRNSGIHEDSSALRHSLNALLYQTGTPSQKFMLVLATNRPQDLDSAILDRMDVSMMIGLPSAEQRHELLKLYMDIHITSMVHQRNEKSQSWFSNRKNKVFSVDEACTSEKNIREIAERIVGFSGREISKLLISLRYKLTMSTDFTLTYDMFDKIVTEKVNEHVEKTEFREVEERERELRSKPPSPIGARGTTNGRMPPERTPPGKLNELELKLARRMKMNGEEVPGIVHLNM